MDQPIWVTAAGSLGTIPEGSFYQTPVVASAQNPGNTVYYQVVAGELPKGFQLTEDGILGGVPQHVGISGEYTRQFVIRAYTKKTVNNTTVIDGFNDRTFLLTISAQSDISFVTPPGNIATYLDATLVSGYQIEYRTTNPDLPVTMEIVAGRLPPALVLTPAGVITGFINFLPADALPVENFEFIVEVTNGESSAIRTFSITILNVAYFTADNTLILSDTTRLTADLTPDRSPIILTPEGSIGTSRSDVFYAYKFNGFDPYYLGIAFEGNTLPPGLALSPSTGWLYGFIPDLGITQQTFDFEVMVFEESRPNIRSPWYNYSLTVDGLVDTKITWLTPSNLGTIPNGSTSLFYVKALVGSGAELQYELASGAYSRLPQGLRLQPDGTIVGRVSFITFTIDQGTTTFDDKDNPYGTNTPTTFDMTSTFTVRAFNTTQQISVIKTFSITVVRAYNTPYQNLYIEALPPINQREKILDVLEDITIFPPELIYRPDDPNFGVSRSVLYYHAYGITAATKQAYLEAMQINHYWKMLTLGPIKTARGTDSAGNVLYEVVYSEIIDNLTNTQGESVNKQVQLAYVVDPGPAPTSVVYPNSLVNMRDQIIDTIGQTSELLPNWMYSKQADGSVLGFTPAWAIAYVKPGEGGKVAYNLRNAMSDWLNTIDFEVDRYDLDNALTYNWDPGYEVVLQTCSRETDVTRAKFVFSQLQQAPYQVGDLIKVQNTTPGDFIGEYEVLETTTTYIVAQTHPSRNLLTTAGTGGHISLVGAGTWIPTPAEMTTFDIRSHYSFEPVTGGVNNPGTGYRVGDVLTVLGTNVGGLTPENDITLKVNTVGAGGSIVSAFISGFGNQAIVGTVFTGVAAEPLPGSGTGATWDVKIVPGYGAVTTRFDGGSLVFVNPSDGYVPGNSLDQYLLFPRRNILSKPAPTY